VADTTRFDLPYQEDTDFVRDARAAQQALAEAVDATMLGWDAGAIGDRPAAGVAGRIYRATTGEVYLDTGATWAEMAREPVQPFLVDTLPADPDDGTEVYYQSAAMATDGLVWHLRFREASASAYKWEVLGSAPPLHAEVASSASPTADGTWRDGVPPGPEVTVPLAGDYVVEFASSCQVSNAGSGCAVGVALGAGGTPPADKYVYCQPGTVATFVFQGRKVRYDAVPSGTLLRLRFVAYFTAQFSQREISVSPVRVG
jgi:hypothetical protein